MSTTVEAEATKACPACGADVLAAAAVCKHCRHRFEGGQPSEMPLRLPPPSHSKGVPRWAFYLGLIAILLLAFAASQITGGEGGNAGGRAASSTPDFTASEIEVLLSEHVGSQTGAEVTGFDCDEQGVDFGDQIRCSATFADGRVEQLVIGVGGTANSPSLEVGLE